MSRMQPNSGEKKSHQVFAEKSRAILYPVAADNRFQYRWILMKEALQRTEKEYGSFSLRSVDFRNETRGIEEVKAGKLTIIRHPTTKKLEKELLAIRIPLLKGLLGYRIFLLHQKNQKKFTSVRNFSDFKNFSCGQVLDWSDVPLLQANGIKVVGSKNYDSLFAMLLAGRFDYFSRSITEGIFEYEQKKQEYPALALEKSICLYYPFVEYFFVSKRDTLLAQRIERGLNLMVVDGSFDRIFWRFFRRAVKKANLKKRRMFVLKNPNLPKSVPFHRKELWLDLNQ
ncbi:MAG: hypothetical protein AAF518_14355 [Spirochaetota bacterium]